MQNTKLLLIILEFEKDLKEYISKKICSMQRVLILLKLQNIKIGLTQEGVIKGNVDKTDIDLLTLNECGELLSLHVNLITPEFKKNIGEYKKIIEEVTQLRNMLVHPFSVENEFEDLDIPFSTSQ